MILRFLCRRLFGVPNENVFIKAIFFFIITLHITFILVAEMVSIWLESSTWSTRFEILSALFVFVSLIIWCWKSRSDLLWIHFEDFSSSWICFSRARERRYMSLNLLRIFSPLMLSSPSWKHSRLTWISMLHL